MARELQTTDVQIAKLNTQLDSANVKNNELTSELGISSGRIIQLTTSLEHLTSELAVSQSKLKNLTEEIAALTSVNKGLTEEIAALTLVNDGLTAANAELEGVTQSWEKSTKQLVRDVLSLTNTFARYPLSTEMTDSFRLLEQNSDDILEFRRMLPKTIENSKNVMNELLRFEEQIAKWITFAEEQKIIFQLADSENREALQKWFNLYETRAQFGAYIFLNHDTKQNMSYVVPCMNNGLKEIRRVREGKYDKAADILKTDQSQSLQCSDGLLDKQNVGFAVPSKCGTTSIFDAWQAWKNLDKKHPNRIAIQAFGVSGSGKTYKLFKGEEGNEAFKSKLEKEKYKLIGAYICEGKVFFKSESRSPRVQVKEFILFHRNRGLPPIFGLEKNETETSDNPNKRIYRIEVNDDDNIYEEAMSVMASNHMIRPTMNNATSTRAFLCLIYQKNDEIVYIWDVPGAEDAMSIVKYYTSDKINGYSAAQKKLEEIHGTLAEKDFYDIVAQSMFINIILKYFGMLYKNNYKKLIEPSDRVRQKKMSFQHEGRTISETYYQLNKEVTMKMICEDEDIAAEISQDTNIGRFFQDNSIRKFVLILLRTWLEDVDDTKTEEKQEIQFQEIKRIMSILFASPPQRNELQTIENLRARLAVLSPD